MKKVVFTVENSFVTSSNSSKDLGITVFDRVFNKLKIEKKSLGKVQPIYLKLGDDHKIFGVMTLNKSGSFSFFPECPEGIGFDHITFVNDLKKGKHHFTAVTPRGREKVLPIEAELLSNGMYHGVSFMIDEHSLLKDAPKRIIYPEVEAESLREIQNAFFNENKPEGSTILNVEGGIGTICVQFFLIPNEVDYKLMTVYVDILKKQKTGFDINSELDLKLFHAVIPHEYQDKYRLGIVAFLYNKKTNNPFFVLTTTKTQGFYSKLEIEWE